ncbi:MAG: hypothetical protein LQ349_005725 [Xanthoria aureola]|nr:MAG: hypothetical protein LQ349_005725 [Xanthoria aureola]
MGHRWAASIILSLGFGAVLELIRNFIPLPFLDSFRLAFHRGPDGLFLGDLELAYPVLPPILPAWAVTLILSIFPVTVLCATQPFVRSGWDFMAAWNGIGLAGAILSYVCAFCKLFVLTPKSTFLSICRPVQPMMDALWHAVPEYERTSRIFFDVSICQGMTSEVTVRGPRYWEIHRALTAFPSGRTVTVWLCAWFLSIYWNAKLRPFAGRRSTSLWRVLLVFFPLTVAVAMTAIFISQHVCRLPEIGVWRDHRASVLGFGLRG